MSSTTTVCDGILQNMDGGKVTGVTFLDLNKAFDTVDHGTLLGKLSRLGMDNVALEWLSSFLTNRCQITYCNGAYSDLTPISLGIAQGSILGPLLFICYMNDLPDVLKHCNVTIYADDTVLSYASKSISEFQSKINSDLRRICEWMQANKLTLNTKKSKFMVIGWHARLSKIDSIVILANNTPLEQVSSFPYLGLVINQNLTWCDHIDHIRSKISKRLGLLRRIKSCLPFEARIAFFNSYILPIFDYCDCFYL